MAKGTRGSFLTFAAACVLAAAFSLQCFAAGATDADGDGLPDSWELQYFGNLSQNEAGDPDSDGYSNLGEYNNGTNPAVAETLPPYLSTLEWTAVGPGGGGAQYNPAIAPNNSNLMYGFCDMGGVYRSLDGGHTWRMYKFDEAQMPVSYSPVHCNPQFNPFDDDICFIGVQSGGLTRTTDGGDTWETVHDGAPATAIAIDRANTSVMFYADNANRMWKSTDGGDGWTEATSWNTTVGETVMDIFIDASSPIASPTVYAATASGIHKSTNGGSSWFAANGNLPSTSISDFNAGMKSNQAVLYAAIFNFGVYRSLDGGTTWSARNTGFNFAAAGHMELGLCDSNPDVLYVGSQENAGPTIYKTTTGGDGWDMVLTDPDAANFPAGVTVERDWMTLTFGWSWGEEPHEVEVCPTDGNQVAFAEDGRTWRSSDGGQSWFCCNSRETALNSNWWPSRGFEVTTNYHTHFAPWDHDMAYITYTDIGFMRSEDRGFSWRAGVQGSPYRNTFYDLAFDPTVPGKMWAIASNNHDLPHEKMLRLSNFLTFTGTVLLSTNYGASWTDLGHPIATNNGAITSIIVDPTSPEGSRTLYCAIMGRGVYKSTNGGEDWAAANTGLSMPGNMSAWRLKLMPDGTLYCALTLAMNPARQRFPGALFKSIDGAANWTKVNESQVLPVIYGFDVDSLDQDVMYVATFQNQSVGGEQGLWKTDDGGATWRKTLDGCDMSGADIDPELRTRVYACMNQGEDWWDAGGTYISEDSGEHWTKMPDMPFERYGPNWVSFDPDNSEIIYVTTFGGGVWKTQVLHAEAPVASVAATPDSGQFPLEVQFDASSSTGDITTYVWDFDDGALSHEASPSHTFVEEGIYTVTLTVEGMNGVSSTTMQIEAVNIDIDGDGLPDVWEEDYFGNLDQGAADDPDGDGATNIEEYNAGTDPTQSDTEPPVVSSLATLPTQVRETLDAQLALTAAADDFSTGNSNIVAGEYFVGVLGAEGSGTAMGVSDGFFNESTEGLTASVPCSSWTEGTVTLYVRARDASGFWSAAENISVPVVDGTAPSAVTDLAVMPALKFDEVASEVWTTPGTVLPQEETLTIDLGALTTVGAVGLTPAVELALFPGEFTIEGSADGSTWTTLAKAIGYKASRGAALWMNAPADYQYARITAKSVRSGADGLFRVKMAKVAVYETTDSNCLRATWRATADDHSLASSGPATSYNLRYSDGPVNAGNFGSAVAVVDGVPVPGVKGTEEAADFSIGSLAGKVYVALKVADEIPNESPISNVAVTDVAITGVQLLGPDDMISAPPDPVIQFAYVLGVDVTNTAIAFSDRPDFPGKPIKNASGTISKTIRFPIKRDYTWWKPTAGQWKLVKALGNNSETAYWRIEARNPAYIRIHGPFRSILFDAGTITDLAVYGSHVSGAEEAVYPGVTSPARFEWTDGTEGMALFFVDISTDPTVPLRDRNKTIALSGAGVPSGPYTATFAEWKAIRRRATGSGGILYWRVRAMDAQKVFVLASAVKTLVMDGGSWALDPIDLSEVTPYVHWTHTGDGILRYSLQFCASDLFEPAPGEIVKMPSGSILADSYMMTSADKTRLLNLAAKQGVSSLFWRVRGEDADKSFITYSDPETVGIP